MVPKHTVGPGRNRLAEHPASAIHRALTQQPVSRRNFGLARSGRTDLHDNRFDSHYPKGAVQPPLTVLNQTHKIVVEAPSEPIKRRQHCRHLVVEMPKRSQPHYSFK